MTRRRAVPQTVGIDTATTARLGDTLGYARVSNHEQNPAARNDRLTDTVTGKHFDRPGLAELIDHACPGDRLCVTRLDRLGRSLRETVDTLKARGIHLVGLEEHLDAPSAAGERIFHAFGAIAHFERRLISERTRDGIAAASMLAEIGPDMSVFGSAHAFAAWAGLSPGNNESSGKRRRSAIRKGSRHLRAAFVEAAHGAVRTPNFQFEGFYRNVAARRGSKRAIVANAHKMARILFVMPRDRDSGTNHEALLGGRNTSRWLRQLDRFGNLEPMGDGTLRVNWNARDAAMQRS